MADSDKVLKLLIEMKQVGAEDVKAAKDLLDEMGGSSVEVAKQMGVVTVTNADVEKATKKTTEAVKEGTERFGEGRREIREVGNELGRLAGVGGAGRLALGGVGAAAFALTAALEFLKSTWEETENTIKGPIEVGLPPNAPAHISAAAEAWKEYAAARAGALASSEGAEAAAGIEEKRLANELSLIKQVLAAEKQKALADLELHKGEMTPDQYAAARENIGNIFGDAGTAAGQKNRRALIANKDMEATNLEIDARNKMAAALAIKSTPAAVAEANQKTLDDNAAQAETAKKEIEERIALIERVRKGSVGENFAEYEGSYGKIRQFTEGITAYKRYGTLGFDDMLGIEKPRLAQAQAAIDVAASYRQREAAASEEKKRLTDEAGAESGKATALRGEIKEDSRFEGQQSNVDAHVAALHQSSAARITGASGQTVEAVQRFTAATVGGFRDVHQQFQNHQDQLERLRAQIQGLNLSHR